MSASKTTIALVLVIVIASSAASYTLGYHAVSHGPSGVVTIAASLYAPYLNSVVKDSGMSGTVVGMGSVAAARQIILEPSAYGIFLSVDPAVIEDMLYPRGISSWYVAVASDQMVIGISRSFPAYSELVSLNSSLNAAISDGNLSAEKEILGKILAVVLSGNYTVGTSDPNTDPEGYRALMMLQLSGIWLHDDQSYYEQELNVLNSSGKLYEVPMGSALFSYLESGRVDFDIALYKSSAIQQGIPHILLPPLVNLGDANYSQFYARSSVEIESGGEVVNLHGAPIYICFTIPGTYPDKTQAALVALYTISPAGRSLLRSYGAVPLATPLLYGNASQVPYPLSALVNTSVLSYAGPIN